MPKVHWEVHCTNPYCTVGSNGGYAESARFPGPFCCSECRIKEVEE